MIIRLPMMIVIVLFWVEIYIYIVSRVVYITTLKYGHDAVEYSNELNDSSIDELEYLAEEKWKNLTKNEIVICRDKQFTETMLRDDFSVEDALKYA